MDCERCRPLLNALADRELPAAHVFAIWGHLLRCSDCRARLSQYRRLNRAARKIRRTLPRPHPARAWGPAFGAVAVAGAVWAYWPRPPTPQALVFDSSLLGGSAKPVSAIYTHGGQYVIEDLRHDRVLGQVTGTERQDVLKAVSLASGTELGTPRPTPTRIPLRLIEEGAGPRILLILRTDPRDTKEPRTVIFFSGPPEQFRGIRLPEPGPHVFVQILNPQFESLLAPSGPFERRLPENKEEGPNKLPERINS